MIDERLSELITNSEIISGSDIPFLEDLTRKYPYFQSAHFLLLLSLKKGNNEKFNQQLRISAIKVPDRHRLFNVLFEEQEYIHKLPVQEEKTANIILEEPVEFQFENSKPEYTIDVTIDNEVSDKQDIMPELLEIEDNNIKTSDPIIDTPISVPLDTYQEESNDLHEKEINTQNDDYSLIDKFIDENPVFTPNKLILDDPREDISLSSVEEDNSLVTETLASIFEMQKLYDKAIGIYEKLILKYPEKSIYFASRISELKEKIK